MSDHGPETFKLRKTEYKLLPPDTYNATITGITVQKSTNPEFGDQLRWRFAVDDLESDGAVPVTGWSSLIYSTKSKTFEWTMAALGCKPDEMPEELTPDVVIGRRVRVLLIIKNKNDGTQDNRVDRVLGPAKAATAQGVAAQVAATIPGAQVKYVNKPTVTTDEIPF